MKKFQSSIAFQKPSLRFLKMNVPFSVLTGVLFFSEIGIQHLLQVHFSHIFILCFKQLLNVIRFNQFESTLFYVIHNFSLYSWTGTLTKLGQRSLRCLAAERAWIAHSWDRSTTNEVPSKRMEQSAWGPLTNRVMPVVCGPYCKRICAGHECDPRPKSGGRRPRRAKPLSRIVGGRALGAARLAPGVWKVSRITLGNTWRISE